MKKIKNIITSILILCLSVCIFSGCSLFSSPSKTTETFFNAIKNDDAKLLSEVYSGKESNIFKPLLQEYDLDEIEDFKEDEVLVKAVKENIYPKLLDFDYEISNEQIKDNKATVDVKITTYPVGNAFTEFIEEFISKAFILAFSDGSEDQITQAEEDILKKQLESLTTKSYEKTATLALTKIDNKWVIDELVPQSDFMDAITGGLITAINNINDLWGEDSEEETSETDDGPKIEINKEVCSDDVVTISAAYIKDNKIYFNVENKSDEDINIQTNFIDVNGTTYTNDFIVDGSEIYSGKSKTIKPSIYTPDEGDEVTINVKPGDTIGCQFEYSSYDDEGYETQHGTIRFDDFKIPE